MNKMVARVEDLAKNKVKGDAIATTFDTQAAAVIAVEKGLEALDGKPGPTFDSLVISAASCLKHLRRADSLYDAAQQVRKVLRSGAAKARFQALSA